MMKKIYILIITIVLGLTSCQEYLNRNNLDTFDEANFWTSEGNMRLYAQGAYTAYFNGYGNGFAYPNIFGLSGVWSDEQNTSSIWTQNTATTGNGWSFIYVRRANIIIDRVEKMPGSEEAKNHWRGIGYFFRAMEYSDLARAFGDVPYYDKEILPVNKEESFKPRDPLATVATKIMEDFQYAVDNVRLNDGVQQINKDVVLAFMSRNLLYFGTYLKYHNGDQVVATALLTKAKWAADQIIASGRYSVVSDYRGLFTSASLAGNKEMVLYREYAEAKVTHPVASYNFTEAQTGASVKTIETYLASDGLPIKQSPVYNYALDNGLRFYPQQYANRDPRMAATLVDTIRVSGLNSAYSTTGFSSWKFMPVEAVSNLLIYQGSTNVTDAPVIRYGEVLMNYAEAAAELGTFTQADADKTINLLRNRDIKKNNVGSILPKLPKLVVAGNTVTANGVTINDPDRDPTISPLLWEIRRERAVELMFEGFRKNDLRRWNKYSYLNTMEVNGVPSKLGYGAYLDLTKIAAMYPKSNYDAMIKNLKFYYPNSADKTKAFIYTLYDANQRRNWIANDPYYERQYLNAVPLDQIKLYKDMGYTLTQNPGWDNIP